MKTKVILLITFMLSVSKLFSQPGTLDVSFGNKGEVLSTTQTGLPFDANALIVKEDGRILVGSGEYISEIKVFLQKQFLTDGTPDSNFGENGEKRTDFGNGVGGNITAMAATRDTDIIAAGIGGLDAGNPHGADILLAKYDSKGNLVPGFGANGLVIVDFGLFEYITCMKLLSNDKILVGGSARKTLGFETNNNYLLARFNADGSLDSSFGDKGKVITVAGPTYGSDINSIAITAEGSIIAAGKAENLYSSDYNKILLAKYTADGKLVTDFGVDGFIFTDPSQGEDFATAVAVQDDGKIVAAGVTRAYTTQAGMCIARYNENGNPDSSFNKTGIRIIYFGKDNASAQSLLIQKDKSFLLGGFKYDNSNNGHYDFALASITQDGSLNSSFGDGGTVTTDFSGFTDYCNAIALQSDGKIVAAGGSSDDLNNISYFSLARYNNDEVKNKKQILISKIRRWLQHRNGFTWDANSNVSNYVVQRSYDGIHFSSVAKINAGSSPNTYEDPSPFSGDNYYCLQTTSTGGLVNYSNVLAVTANEDAIKISPNPAKNNLHIDGLSSNQKTKFIVVDFNGNVKLQAIANSVSYNLNVATLTTGNYLLKIENGGHYSYKKVCEGMSTLALLIIKECDFTFQVSNLKSGILK